MGTVKTKKGEYKILLERVQKENNPPVWLFSSETLKLVPQIYEEIDVPWLERHLPAAMTETRFAGQPLYRWIIPLLVHSPGACSRLALHEAARCPGARADDANASATR